jgi:hypothetical protein
MDLKKPGAIKSTSSKSRSKGSRRYDNFVEGTLNFDIVYTEGPILSGRMSSKPTKHSQGTIPKKLIKSKPTAEIVADFKHTKLKQYINQVPSFFKKYS